MLIVECCLKHDVFANMTLGLRSLLRLVCQRSKPGFTEKTLAEKPPSVYCCLVTIENNRSLSCKPVRQNRFLQLYQL